MLFALDLVTVFAQQALFYLFSALALISAIMVIMARSPIDSVLFLILVFTNATGLLILMGVEFLAMIFLVVYVGAIAVLFLFIVMMLNTKLSALTGATSARYLPTGIIIASIFLTSVFLLIDYNFRTVPSFNDEFAGIENLSHTWVDTLPIITANTHINIEVLGNVLYTTFAYPFILSGIILLLAMMGAIVLTHHRRSQDTKRQIIAEQVYRNPNEIIKLIKNK